MFQKYTIVGDSSKFQVIIKNLLELMRDLYCINIKNKSMSPAKLFPLGRFVVLLRTIPLGTIDKINRPFWYFSWRFLPDTNHAFSLTDLLWITERIIPYELTKTFRWFGYINVFSTVKFKRIECHNWFYQVGVTMIMIWPFLGTLPNIKNEQKT